METETLDRLLVAELRARFPADAAVTDAWLRERGWEPADDDIPFIWVEAFADRTTDAIKRRDADTVRAHTHFIADAYRVEPDALRAIVDVSYAENLMWNASAADKQWAWKFIPDEVRQFFMAMWGDPTLDRKQ